MGRMACSTLQISVITRYVPEQSTPLEEVYTFAYTITVANNGAHAAQLVSRHWRILDADGHLEEVKGLGVVGQQPMLRPGQAFEYESGCRLRTPTGTMHGQFFFLDDEGERYSADVPLFVLDATGHTGQSKKVH